MSSSWQGKILKPGFTIVELIVVISVIAVLATVSIVGYSSWRTSTIATKVKNDLNAVATAMEDYRTFNNGYSATLPTTVTASSGVNLSVFSSTSTTYCVDGASTENVSIIYYVASETNNQGALAGTCATRPTLPVPTIPTGLAISGATGATATLTWIAGANAATYTTQCASDAGFILGLVAVDVVSPTVTAGLTGLTPSTSIYCRVKSVNNSGQSAWTTASTSTTTSAYGSLAVATSIDGYWTTTPTGYLSEDGAAVSRTTYAALFAVIGTTYGVGDGSTTFNLPDSRGRTAVNRSLADTEFDVMGEKPGSKTEQLTIAQMPSHTHKLPWQTVGDVSDYLGGSGAAYGMSTSYNAGTVYDLLEPVGGDATHNNIQPSIVKTSVIKFAPIEAGAVTLPEGSTIDGYWTTAPTGYLLEDGSAVSRTTYATLFSVIGTTYGVGDGSTTFNVPDSRGRTAVNRSLADTEFDVMGEKYGTKNETLTIAQMPSHSHKVPWQTVADVSDYLGGSGASYGIAYSYSLRQGTYDPLEPVGDGGAHNNIQPSIVKTSAIKFSSSVGSGDELAAATSLNGYWTTAPTGYLLEDGSAVSRTTYATLFSVIGTTYGVGDGSTTFNVPDSRGRTAVNRSLADTEFDVMGEKPGSKTEQLTIAQMPSHTHKVTWQNNGSDVSDYLGGSGASYGIAYSYSLRQGTYDLLESVGGDAAHNNIQPSIVKLFVIKY